jgi:hypothetical protein
MCVTSVHISTTFLVIAILFALYLSHHDTFIILKTMKLEKKAGVYDVAIKHTATAGNISKLPLRAALVLSQIKLIKK